MRKKIYLMILVIFLFMIGIISYMCLEIFNKRNYDMQLSIDKNIPLMKSLSQIPKSNTIPFKLYLKYRDNGRRIKAGNYSIIGEYNLVDLINLLESGKGRIVKITIPEGYSIKQIIEVLEKNGKIDRKKFYEELNDAKKNFPYPVPEGNFEGYLYPETYFLPENFDEKTAVEALLKEFLKKVPYSIYGERKDFYEKLIMASILEREAKLNDEKPKMASVFYNRMKKGMTLSSDATVNFIYDYRKKRMLYRDLEIDSPYNTYKYKGLPPAPICNPTIQSIQAAYNPDETEYLFFVATGDGGHYFSKTYKEHLEFQKNNKKITE